MNREIWIDKVMAMDVLDTHTHLIGYRLVAGDFWEIAHYFWFFRELQSAGYPSGAAELEEESRINEFLKAYHASRNTLMNWTFTSIMRDLYGVEISDPDSVRRADAAVREKAKRSDWAQAAADRLSIRRFVVNYPEHAEFQGMREPAVLIPRIDGNISEWAKAIAESETPERKLEEIETVIAGLFSSYKRNGCEGVMTTLPRYASSANKQYVLDAGTSKDETLMRVLHAVSHAAEREGLLVQLFLGVERSWCGTAFPANDPERILKLAGLFERYPSCTFEIVLASEINNMDAVQAAWNFPNVHVGGMWWFNFRSSTYRQSMQYRIEAIAACKSSLVVSDARCMEWSYGKIKLIKRLLGEFLADQVEGGWLAPETAEAAAREWLYESAARRYGVI
ncbi:glucuronate isomerase [Paenibacillus puerhi]|uniref:glucuronate isomerase n=1 Tax=Paenibacillus puerhi TaxID=2692622 RepID=UPI00135B35F3|nr:glucuronate isomerase [Paenibacillus puerhi]